MHTNNGIDSTHTYTEDYDCSGDMTDMCFARKIMKRLLASLDQVPQQHCS